MYISKSDVRYGRSEGFVLPQGRFSLLYRRQEKAKEIQSPLWGDYFPKPFLIIKENWIHLNWTTKTQKPGGSYL